MILNVHHINQRLVEETDVLVEEVGDEGETILVGDEDGVKIEEVVGVVETLGNAKLALKGEVVPVVVFRIKS